MKAVRRHGPTIGLLLALLASTGHGWTGAAVVGVQQTARVGVGSEIPPLTLPALRPDAEPVQLASYRGKVIVLDFWSSWCAPCRQVMPQLDALRRDFPRERFEVVGVNVDLLADDARRFLERTPVSYPIAADTGGLAARQLGVDVLPALFLVDAEGVVREAFRGEAVGSPQRLRTSLTDLLEQQDVR